MHSQHRPQLLTLPVATLDKKEEDLEDHPVEHLFLRKSYQMGATRQDADRSTTRTTGVVLGCEGCRHQGQPVWIPD